MNEAKQFGEAILALAGEIRKVPPHQRPAWVRRAQDTIEKNVKPEQRDLSQAFVLFALAIAEVMDRAEVKVESERAVDKLLAELPK